MASTMLRRRDFSVAALLAALPVFARAQGGPVEGQQYRRLAQPLPASSGKIEVLEFFWFGCPHCYVFDAPLEAWVKQLPADVAFRRVPIGAAAMQRMHQKMFYALEAMGREAELHARIFKAIHVEHQDISEEAGMLAMLGKLGVDMGKFKAAYGAFGVQGKVAQANKLSSDYGLEHIPSLGIGGRFLTSPSMAGLPSQNEVARGQQSLAVTDFLLRQVRASNKA